MHNAQLSLRRETLRRGDPSTMLRMTPWRIGVPYNVREDVCDEVDLSARPTALVEMTFNHSGVPENVLGLLVNSELFCWSG